MIKKYNEMFENKNENQRLNWGCAVVLDDKSKTLLAEKFSATYAIMFDVNDWKKFAHHMTIAFGRGLECLGLEEDEGKLVELKVTHAGHNDMVCAIRVEGYPTTNKTPHITLGVNVKDGGKPIMSNQIEKWNKIEPFILTGIVTEMKQKK
jgi:hypothetical protein